MSKPSSGLSQKIIGVLSHRYFFVAILLFFLFEMTWIALSAIYPALFDEEYHLGIIEIYSHQLSPFLASQPPRAAFHGDITRYDSYFFHYLMSFGYRLIQVFTDDLMAKVIALRFICIGLVLAGFTIFRSLLIRGGLSRALTHVTLLFFVLIPIVPFALAQLNYDALLFLLIPLMLYVSLRFAQENKNQAVLFVSLLITGFFAAIVQFSSLPVFLGCLVFVSVITWRRYGKKSVRQLFSQYFKMPYLKTILLSLLLAISFGLFAERYGLNIITYHELEPDCDQVQVVSECLANNVFRRNYTSAADSQAKNTKRDNLFIYSTEYWVPHIFGDFFVTGSYVNKQNTSPKLRYLPQDLHASGGNHFLRYAVFAVLVVSLLATILLWRQLPHRRLRYLFLIVFVIYAASLLIKTYNIYLAIGIPVAAQGRYFIVLLIPVLAVFAVTCNTAIKRLANAKLILLLVGLLVFSQGGGVASYILYSQPDWYWPKQRHTISRINHTARQVLQSFSLR